MLNTPLLARFLFFSLMFSPLLWRGFVGDVFAQNTFRYELCPKTSPFAKNPAIIGPVHQVSSDSGYIAFGNGASPYDSEPHSGFCATKLDKYGNISWIKVWLEGLSYLQDHTLVDGITTSDGGFAMVGYTRYPYNTVIQKTDKDGNLLWSKQFGMGSPTLGVMTKIRQLPDDGFIVMGAEPDGTYAYAFNTFLLRLDKNGAKIWSYQYDAETYGKEIPNSLDITADGGFIVGGRTTNGDFDRNTRLLDYKGFMIKVNGDGTLAWARRYGNINKTSLSGKPFGYSDGLDEVQQTPDGGFIAVGYTDYVDANDSYGSHNSRGWVVKTDASGVIEWHRTYSMIPTKVEITTDGYALLSYNKIVKITKTGDFVWSKRYDIQPGYFYDPPVITDMHLALDSGFIMSTPPASVTYGEGIYKGITVTNRGAIVMKTDHLGEFDKDCFYTGYETSWVDSMRIDTLYSMISKNVSDNLSTLVLTTTTITNQTTCPVICGISNKPVAPEYVASTTTCVNTDIGVGVNNAYKSAYNVQYSHYKVNFGDPGSGAKNETTGSGFISAVYHNYSNAGTYAVTVTYYNSDYSESETRYATVTVIPQATQTVLTPSIQVCNKDTVTLTAQIHNYVSGLFSVRWSQESSYYNGNPTILSQTDILNDSVLTTSITVATDTAEHYYTLLSFAGNCEFYDTIRVKRGDNEALITGDTKICSGGSTQLAASGGDTYLWSTGAKTQSITVSPASNKTYWVEAKTTDGCRDTGYVYVQVVSAINVEMLVNPDKAVCLGDTVTLTATGAQNYIWNTGSNSNTIQVIPPYGQTTYNVTGTSGSCTATASIQLSADSIPTGNFMLPTSVGCSGTYTLTASGADSYYWWGNGVSSYYDAAKNPVQTIYAADYPASVTMTKGGCTNTREFSVSSSLVPLSPKIGGINLSECRVCPGTTVTLKTHSYLIPWYAADQNLSDNPENQGLTYQWSTGQLTAGLEDSIQLVVTGDTLITLTTTNQYGCSTVNSELIQAKPYFYIKSQASAVASCSNSPTTLYLLGEPLDDFTWSNGSKNDTVVVSPLQDTIFKVTVTSDGCTRTDSVFVYAKSNLPKAAITGDAVVCKGVASTYTASGNATSIGYLWLSDNSTNPDFSIAPTTDTTIKAEVTFTGGCKDTAEYKIEVTDPEALITGDTLICPGAIVSLKASGGFTYEWSTGSSANVISVTALADTPISLYVFSANCSDTTSVIIKTNQTITATLFADEDTICSGTALTLIAGGGEAYTWNTGENGEMIGISPASSTTYTVNVSTEDNCFDAASITISVNPSPTLSISGQTSLCAGRSATLQAISNGTGYLWNTGESTATITVTPISDSAYSVSTFIEQCSDSISHTITVLATTSISAGPDQTVLQGTEITLTPSGGTDYNWSTIDGVICNNCNTIYENPDKTTTYYLSETGVICSEDSVTIYILNCVGLYVPTAFSPNGDGTNDVLYLKNDCVKQLDFKIYDRWGNVVFEATNVGTGWNGAYKGEEMDPAVFVYYVSAVLFSGETINRKGNVSLIR